jgi:hypothetical protein
VKFVHVANSIELERQSHIIRAHPRWDCRPGGRVGRICPAGQRQDCAVILQSHVVLTRRKDFTVTFKAEGHIDRSLVDGEGSRCAKDGCKNEHPRNRAHNCILLLKEHPRLCKIPTTGQRNSQGVAEVVESNPFRSTKCLLRSVAFLQKWRAHASVSLADFAKIVEQLGSQKVSFLSVTQQFNTTRRWVG